ncbi:hypothetical protein [Rhizobium sp. TRM95796]|uniref:hypothetical protein n=1 Tax=Rhizobium sp. TRM95796 TaxID=2979862 RepID=UPI0021E7B3D4|nr:hypothetical protein [Rhizobium sp. TRM95796]MCV3765812.1 hypothetical protein [Rhizobium sp. TRM95796]
MQYFVMTAMTILAFLVAATATGGPSGNVSGDTVVNHSDDVATNDKNCVVRRDWATDFHGSPYLRKTRICG